MKVCNKCGEEKPRAEFYKNKAQPDGYRYECKPCTKNAAAAFKEADPERVRQYKKTYRQRNPEKVSAYEVKRREENREAARERGRRYRVRKRNAESTLTDAQWWLMRFIHDNRCAKCGKEEVTLDHVVALANGGNHTMDNVQPLCLSCNSGKGAHHNTDYRRKVTITFTPYGSDESRLIWSNAA